MIRRTSTSFFKLLPFHCFKGSGTKVIEQLHSLSVFSQLRNLSTNAGKFENEDFAPFSSETFNEPEIVRTKKKKSFNFDKPNKFITKDAETYLTSLKMEYPQLEDFPEDQVVRYLEFMSTYGFRVSKATEMIFKYPQILDNYSTLLTDSLGSFQQLGFSDRQQRKILVRYPQLLTFPRKSIVSRASFLKSYFTSDELHKLIEDNLSVIFDREDIVQQKLEYLIKEASHSTEEISKCNAVSHPLQFIKTRHQFLIRAGLFEVIPYQKYFKVIEKIKQKVSTAPGGLKFRQKYFTPHEVVCFSDEIFLKVCTNNVFTLNELAAFEEMYNKEYGEEKENYVNDDDEEEEDNDLSDSLLRIHNSTGHFSEVEAQVFYY